MLDAVQNVLNGEYVSEMRFLLVPVKRDGNPIATAAALNDVVLHPSKSTRMIAFDLWIEGPVRIQPAFKRPDCIDTNRSSTAYSLSGGGPIVHRAGPALVLVPMFHIPSPADRLWWMVKRIKIVIDTDLDIYQTISCDGQTHIPARPAMVLHHSQKAHKLEADSPQRPQFL